MNLSALVLALSVVGQVDAAPMPAAEVPVLSKPAPAAPAPGGATARGYNQNYGPLNPQTGAGYGYAAVADVDCDSAPAPEYAGCPNGRRPAWVARCRNICRGGCLECDPPGCWSCCGCRCCLLSTCDLYPHYAYYPENHGYYYFRPYNWTSIGIHQSFAATWGLDPLNPYSRVFFDQLYGDRPRAVVTQPVPLPHNDRLPMLESLLDPLPE